jgi:2-polyprenyl-6-methoxyphenol hydroxylase-like FAD-dependent oxidoreductase
MNGTFPLARKNRRVLILGLGIAGPTLGWWLAEYGFEVTIVEHAPRPRAGGYMIDFWGLGYDVAERMGLLHDLRRAGYAIDTLRLMRRNGDVLADIGAEAITSALGGRYFGILRGDLANALYRRVADRVSIRFADRVDQVVERMQSVKVAFGRSPETVFDLVIGAGGVHSELRDALFPDAAEEPMGFWTAAFSTCGYPHRTANAYVSFTEVGRQVARYALRDGRTVFFFLFRAPGGGAGPPRDRGSQVALLRQVYGDAGWECREILATVDRCDDLYFDAVAQVKAPRWSRGRLALVGDAAYCPSLLAGEGASLAMAGAYILAGELYAASGDFREAFQRYEAILRPVIERKQRGARRMGGWFAPRTHLGLQIRNGLSQMAATPGLSRVLLGGLTSAGMELPSYPSRAASSGHSGPDRADPARPAAPRGHKRGN